jgi:hypothetical protein
MRTSNPILMARNKLDDAKKTPRVISNASETVSNLLPGYD